jgi:hypothetical protein
MSKLVIFGNINKITFCNAIVAAQDMSKRKFEVGLSDIFVLHTPASFRKLFSNETDWLEFLKQYGIDESIFVNRIMSEASEEKDYFRYVKMILDSSRESLDMLIIDATNGTSEHKALLNNIAYVLSIPNIYFIDIRAMVEKSIPRDIYCAAEDIRNCYKKLELSEDEYDIAYMNATEIKRYDRIIDILASDYNKSCNGDGDDFFSSNLVNAIRLKLENDSKKRSGLGVPNANLYRMISSAIVASLEELLNASLIELSIDPYEGKMTLGKKLGKIEEALQNKRSAMFDYKFYHQFSEFILYLRNTASHKGKSLGRSDEQYKADLSVDMLLVFLDYYLNVVIKELQGIDTQSSLRIKDCLEPMEAKYYGLDGDNTGNELEGLLLSSSTTHKDLESFSKRVDEARNAVTKYVTDNKGKVIFSAGDDILFTGKFDLKKLEEIKQLYFDSAHGYTCSIAYAKTFRELLFSMKFAKMEKNTIRGIEIVSQ